jgi:hypothetical protein
MVMSDFIQQACRHEFEADWQRTVAVEMKGEAQSNVLEKARRHDEMAAALWKLAGVNSRPGCFVGSIRKAGTQSPPGTRES